MITEENQPRITSRAKRSFNTGMMTQWWFKNSPHYDPSVIDPDFDTWVWGEAPIDPTFCEEPYRGPIYNISGPSSVNGRIPRTPEYFRKREQELRANIKRMNRRDRMQKLFDMECPK